MTGGEKRAKEKGKAQVKWRKKKKTTRDDTEEGQHKSEKELRKRKGGN